MARRIPKNRIYSIACVYIQQLLIQVANLLIQVANSLLIQVANCLFQLFFNIHTWKTFKNVKTGHKTFLHFH